MPRREGAGHPECDFGDAAARGPDTTTSELSAGSWSSSFAPRLVVTPSTRRGVPAWKPPNTATNSAIAESEAMVASTPGEQMILPGGFVGINAPDEATTLVHRPRSPA